MNDFFEYFSGWKGNCWDITAGWSQERQTTRALRDCRTLEFGLASGFEPVKEVGEHLAHDVEDLVIVLVKGHLQVEAGELGQMAVGVGLLRAEHGSDLEHALKVARDDHLLVDLG